MEFDEYQKLASRTADFAPEDAADSRYQLMYFCLGLAGETGEVIEKVKKVLRNDKGVMSNEARELIKLEIGDVLWYLSQLARVLDMPFDETAQANIKKLEGRAARGVIASQGDTR